MSNTTSVRKAYSALEKQEQFDGYSKVVIAVSDENNIGYSAGTDTGRTLTLNCPFGTQQMAEDILEKVRGYQYQPYSATGAHIDPAAEIGDGITVGGVYGGLFAKDVTHSHLYTANVSAPGGEKINYAYPFKTVQEREIERNFRDVSARFSVQADRILQEVEERKEQGEIFKAQLRVQSARISAKVENTGGDGGSFGWTLTDDSWTLTSNGSTVLTVNKDGLEVKGKINATSGKIGGFTIEPDYLSFNNQGWLGTNTVGIYIGPKGLQLGKNFRVDMYGNLSATSGHFEGSVFAGNILYTSQNIAGTEAGYLNGEALEALSVQGYKITGSTLSTAKFTSGVNESLGYADFSNGVFNGWNTANTISCGNLYAANVYFGSNEYKLGTKTISYKDGSGNTQYLNVVTFS